MNNVKFTHSLLIECCIILGLKAGRGQLKWEAGERTMQSSFMTCFLMCSLLFFNQSLHTELHFHLIVFP